MLLSLDYGKKRMGVAVSDETETIAMPLDAIFVKNYDDTLGKLRELVEKYSVNKIVIGLPLGHENKPTQMSNEITEFANNLSKELNIEIALWNEVFTSHLARKNLNKNTRSGKVDSESARIILQEYLDHNS